MPTQKEKMSGVKEKKDSAFVVLAIKKLSGNCIARFTPKRQMFPQRLVGVSYAIQSSGLMVMHALVAEQKNSLFFQLTTLWVAEENTEEGWEIAEQSIDG